MSWFFSFPPFYFSTASKRAQGLFLLFGGGPAPRPPALPSESGAGAGRSKGPRGGRRNGGGSMPYNENSSTVVQGHGAPVYYLGAAKTYLAGHPAGRRALNRGASGFAREAACGESPTTQNLRQITSGRMCLMGSVRCPFFTAISTVLGSCTAPGSGSNAASGFGAQLRKALACSAWPSQPSNLFPNFDS